MRYARFVFYSFSGSVFWIGFFVYGGYYFGNIPLIKNNLTVFILGIIVVSILPGVIGYVRQKFRRA
jgi:membrane-associated protein